MDDCSAHREIREALVNSRIAFEAFINNVVDAKRPPLSMQSVPVDLLCRSILELEQFKEKQFYFLLDEYENLLDYQQQVVNTLIKHSGELYSFKVGVRELGWRFRSTLNVNEQLVHPADYALINIAEKLQGSTFEKFALDVCRERIARITSPNQEIIRDLRTALPSLSDEEESIKLGVEEQSEPVRQKLLECCGSDQKEMVEALHPLEVYFIQYWAESQSQSVEDVFKQDVTSDPSAWNTRYGNYKHAILYTIRRKKRGNRKYYCGWNTFAQLAAGNIRYVPELVDQSFLAHFQQTESLETPISPDVQTKTVQRVGSTNLSELEGLSVDGAQLTKLLLSLGRVFQIMAGDPFGHTPEVNQFQLGTSGDSTEDAPISSNVERLLNSAVMHLALLRTPGNKPGDVGDTKDYDYMIHPIFSGLFVFSPRRKRKMTLTPETLLRLITKPKQTIRSVLHAHNRTVEDDLPEQLTLFEGFYNADS